MIDRYNVNGNDLIIRLMKFYHGIITDHPYHNISSNNDEI